MFVSFSLFKVLALAKKEIAASEEKKEKEENAVLAALGADGGISRLKSFELTTGAGRGESIAARRKTDQCKSKFSLCGPCGVCCGVLCSVVVWCGMM